jgi:hypothetical protein
MWRQVNQNIKPSLHPYILRQKIKNVFPLYFLQNVYTKNCQNSNEMALRKMCHRRIIYSPSEPFNWIPFINVSSH